MSKCAVCGGPEHPEWKAHVFGDASNSAVLANASNASNKELLATNRLTEDELPKFEASGLSGDDPIPLSECRLQIKTKTNGETPLDQPVIPVVAQPSAIGVDGPERRTPIRSNREAYNAYQRDLMRKRRAAQKNKNLVSG